MSEARNQIRCKCCDGHADFFGAVDFAKTCEDRKGSAFPPAGKPVPYFRCRHCGFVFTTFCDAWSAKRMADEIYNDDYVLADPEFVEKRPRHFSGILTDLFERQRRTISILDYGGGRGTLVSRLRTAGFADCATFDPFFGETATLRRRHDLVTAFEVVEHSRDPLGTFRDALSYMAAGGALLFTTTVQPDPVDPHWWYIAPRNGHCSIHTRLSLSELARRCGAYYFSFDPNLHMLYRDKRSPVARTIARNLAKSALFQSSRQGFPAYLLTTYRIALLGVVRPTINPRHFLRTLIYSVKPTRNVES